MERAKDRIGWRRMVVATFGPGVASKFVIQLPEELSTELIKTKKFQAFAKSYYAITFIV